MYRCALGTLIVGVETTRGPQCQQRERVPEPSRPPRPSNNRPGNRRRSYRRKRNGHRKGRNGSGSAAAVAAIASARATSPVKVVAPGGSQTVRWEKQVYLQGPATLVCRGEFFI